MDVDLIYYIVENFLLCSEFCCGLLSFVCSVIFGAQFWNAQHFHENLRKCIFLLNFFICFCPILHPITVFLGKSESSPVTSGKYSQAVVLYTSQILHHVSILFLHTKYFLLIVERAFAYRERKSYENSKNSYVLKLMLGTAFLCICEISTKLVVLKVVEKGDTVDVWLSKAFTVDRSPSYFLFTYVLAVSSGVIGYMCFANLLSRAQFQRHKSQSLSERFELRQTEVITTIMRPLCTGYCLCVASVMPTTIVAARIVFWGDDPAWQRIYGVLIMYGHWIVGVYNVGATIYTMQKMKAMSGKSRVGIFCHQDETERHFSQLAEQWKGENIRR
ncbi:unnamed protein product [Bursaphelenchus xylophilus]|uniref:(pine wood nematode) hypothetical protein n=1 Tax=Bursaphelenchus xylophilus TaxID=6326 RepID=A0A1I7RMB3_BURXY|nr:unnamed protein product [Bursaphelenchus xylophilus]CAG9118350.1 unnamed protein product [Bursaphelenchus xylophilus]